MRYAELIEKAQETAGLYVAAYYDEESEHALKELQQSLDLKNPSDPDEFHSTIVYSKKRIHWRAEHDVGHLATPAAWAVFPSHSKERHALVLLLDSKYLETRFKLAMNRGASYDFPEYKPHITMSYDVGPDFDVEALPVPDLKLIIDFERAEELSD